MLGLHCFAWAFSGCGEQGLFIVVSALVMELGLQARGLQYLWHTGLVALRQVRSSQTGLQTAVPCIARQTANHWTTRETLKELLKSKRTHENQTQGHPPGAGLARREESLVKGLRVAWIYWSPEEPRPWVGRLDQNSRWRN